MNVADAHPAEDGSPTGAATKTEVQKNAEPVKCPEGNGESKTRA